MFNAPPLQPLLLWQSLMLFWFCGLLMLRLPLLGAAFGALFFLVDIRLRNFLCAFVALALCAVGYFTACALLPPRPTLPAWAHSQNVPIPIELEGQVLRVQSLPDARLRIFLEKVRPVGGEQAPLPGIALWTWDVGHKTDKTALAKPLHIPLPGQWVRLKSALRSSQGFRNTWGSDFGFYWQTKGVFWRIWSRNAPLSIRGSPHYFAKQREKAVRALDEAVHTASIQQDIISAEALAFLPALLLGEKFALGYDTLQQMQAFSLIHSLALSGQHLALAGLVAVALVGGLSALWPKIFLFVPRYKLLALCAVPLAILYLWLGNAPPSLMRAAGMAFMALFLLWRGQVLVLQHVLFCTVCVISLCAPLSLYDIGLQLSVLCVFAICLVVPALNYLLPNRKPWIPRTLQQKISRFFLKIFCISLAIQVALLPVMLLYFPPSGLWFMANIFWLPILTLWVLPLAALSLFMVVCALPGATQMLLLAALPCEGLLRLLHRMQEYDLLTFYAVLRPHWSVLVAWAALMVVWALGVGRISWQDIRLGCVSMPLPMRTVAIVAGIMLCVGPALRYAEYMRMDIDLTMYDVGQGQAVAVRLPAGVGFMVDGGGSFSSRFEPGTQVVLPSLVYNAPPRLWAMFASHPDVDHMRGLLHLLPHVSPLFFYGNGGDFNKKDKYLWEKAQQALPSLQSIILHQGQSVALPWHSYFGSKKLYMEVLWPPAGIKLTKNNSSLILRLVEEAGQQKRGLVLFCADAEISALEALLASGQDVTAKVLILPHHGAKDAYVPALYAAVNPQVALASAGRENRFGHPHAWVRNALNEQGIALYNTAEVGAIKVIFGDALRIERVRQSLP